HVRHDSTFASSPLRPGQSGNAFMDCAAPLAGEPVFAKTVNSAFIGTHLQDFVREFGSSRLLFAGLTSDHCVSTSVRMAANLGLHATVALDATATFPRRDHEGHPIEAEVVHRVALASLDQEFATLKTTEALVTSGGDQ